MPNTSRLLLSLLTFTAFSLGCSAPKVDACEEGAVQACELTEGCGGTQQCTGGTWSTCIAPEERCDGVDNDCDGHVDEDFANLGEACEVGQGACGASGTWSCSEDGASVVCSASAGDPQGETCNGIDDDCNGETDDVEGAGASCVAGVGACEQSGNMVCDLSEGALTCNASPGTPTAEVCNGIDDDCNGKTDDVPGAGAICVAGIGACERHGRMVCDATDGSLVCDATPGTATDEVCNGIDDDCDGEIDELQVSFFGPLSYPADKPCDHLALGDLDGDGLKDVVCAPGGVDPSAPDTRLFTYRGIGNGTFQNPQYLQPVAVSPFRAQNQVALGDLDGDGDLDIVAVGETMRAQVYLNAGNGTFAPPYDAFQFPSGGEPGTGGLLLMDFDGDGDLDIATTTGSIRDPRWRLMLSLNDGSAGFGAPITVDDDVGRGFRIHSADVDHDDDLDLILVSRATVKLYRHGGPGVFQPPVTVLTGDIEDGNSLLTDLDADGFPDLLIPGPGIRYLLPGTSNGFGDVVTKTSPATEVGVAAGQIDCDPTPEVFILAANGGAPLYYLSSSPSLEHVNLVPGVYGKVIELADLNGDGDLDVIYGGSSTGIHVLLRE